MSNITTLEQAKRLKKLGFREKVRAYYAYGSLDYNNPINWNTNEGLDENGEYQDDDSYYSAPTIPEALDLIREEKEIHCSVSFVFKYNDRTDNVIAQYFGQVLQTFPQFIDQVTEDFDTHHLAESALLDAVLTYLENKGE